MYLFKKWSISLVKYIVLNKLSAWDCRQIFDQRLSQDKKIALYWGTDDVIHRCKEMYNHDLSEEHAFDILQTADHRHDANEGINWIVLDVYIEDKLSYLANTVNKVCLLCGSDDTKPDNDFKYTMRNCNACGSEWNFKGEITLDPTLIATKVK